jgi:hypothetical protein
MNSQFVFDTEEILVETLVHSLQCNKQNFILREVDCWQGRADVVEVISDNIQDQLYKFSEEQIILLRNLTCAKIISILNYNAVRSREFIYKTLGLQHRTIDSWLIKLINTEIIIEIKKDRFIIHPEFILPRVKFTAYEAKLYNWKRALYQATQYKGFSNKAYVVMPKKYIKPAIKNLQAFIANNIGLIEVHDDGKCETVLKAKEIRPTGKSFALIAIGIALNQLKHTI